MTAFAAPALMGALLERLRVRFATESVVVSWGWPGGDSEPREWVKIGDVDGDTQPVTIGPTFPREETSELSVTIKVRHATTIQQGVTERAYEIADDVDAEIRSDLTIGGTVRTALLQGPFSLRQRESGQEREAELTLTVTYRARL